MSNEDRSSIITAIIGEGIEHHTLRIERRRKAELRRARDLGRPPEEAESLSPWRKSLLNECPYKYRVAGELYIAPVARDPNREYGSAIHEAFAVLAKTGDFGDAVKAFQQFWTDAVDGLDFEGKKFTAEDLEAMAPKTIGLLAQELDGSEEVYGEGVEHWFDWSPIRDPESGEEIEGWKYSGRCDLPRKRKGEPATIEDLKTTASSTPEKDLVARAGIDEQLTQYVILAENDSLLAPLGIEHAARLEANKAKRALRVTAFPVRHVTDQDKRALFLSTRDAIMRIQFYREQEESGATLEEAWPRNYGACFGKFGICDLAPICHPHLFPDTDLENEFGVKTLK